jgi:transcriptional antiterminator Rof (Rho-off)
VVAVGNCDFVTDRAVIDALRVTNDATGRYVLQTWRLMRELQDGALFRARASTDENNRRLRVRYMANELTEANWKVTLQRHEKDANFHLANNHVKEVFVNASRDLIRQVLEPGVDMSLVKAQLDELFAYCNKASDMVSKRFMRRARVYEIRTPIEQVNTATI